MQEPLYSYPDPERNRPAVKRGLDLWLQWLGMLLPFGVTYGPFAWTASLTPAISSIGLWVSFTAALASRRNWRATLIVTATFALLSVPWLVLLLASGGYAE